MQPIATGGSFESECFGHVNRWKLFREAPTGCEYTVEITCPCEHCEGQGEGHEYYGGSSNYDGAPNERAWQCDDCAGTGDYVIAIESLGAIACILFEAGAARALLSLTPQYEALLEESLRHHDEQVIAWARGKVAA